MTNRDTRTNVPEQAERRLANLRREFPTAVVQFDSVRADDTAIAVKALVSLPNHARHTRIEARDVDPNRSWAEQYEQVQALAVLRALDGLGVADDQPQPVGPQPQDALRPRPQESAPARQQPAAQPQTTSQPQAPSPASPGANAVQRADGDHLSEYSWTSFWQAARARNITRDQVEEALGRPIQQATPRDAVEALESAGMWG